MRYLVRIPNKSKMRLILKLLPNYEIINARKIIYIFNIYNYLVDKKSYKIFNTYKYIARFVYKHHISPIKTIGISKLCKPLSIWTHLMFNPISWWWSIHPTFDDDRYAIDLNVSNMLQKKSLPMHSEHIYRHH